MLSTRSIRDWHPRAPTAVAVDIETLGATESKLLAEIAQRAGASHYRIRLLIISLAPVKLHDSLPDQFKQVLIETWHEDVRHGGAYPLGKITTTFVHDLRRAYEEYDLPDSEAAKIGTDTDGITLYTAIKARDLKENPRIQIVKRVSRAFDRASALGEIAPKVLTMSVLSGPIQLDRHGNNKWLELDADKRAKVFSWKRQPKQSLAQRLRIIPSTTFEIPAYEPKLEGAEVLLAFVSQEIRKSGDGSIDTTSVDLFLERAIKSIDERVLDRIVSLLCRHPLVEDAWRCWSDEKFRPAPGEYADEETREGRIAAIVVLDKFAMRHRRRQVLDYLERFVAFTHALIADERGELRDSLEREWLNYMAWARIGIGDREIGLEAAKGAFNAALRRGTLAWAEADQARRDGAARKMEEALAYLRDLADARFHGDREIGLPAAMGAYNAAVACGKLGIGIGVKPAEIGYENCVIGIGAQKFSASRVSPMCKKGFSDAEY